MKKKHYVILFLVCFFPFLSFGQTIEELSFETYVNYVKQQHPLVKKANLQLDKANAKLTKAKGNFDPKIIADYDRKFFKGTEYYDELNATLKQPIWYGIEAKVGYERNEGEFLNPNLTVPEEGLYSAGISVNLARGFLINDRMATLKKARLYREQTKAENELTINTILVAASKAYFEWLKTANEYEIQKLAVAKAIERKTAVERSVEAGDKPAILVTEALITEQNRRLKLEAITLKKQKALLNASNFLWFENTPIEIKEGITPELIDKQNVVNVLEIEEDESTQNLIDNHPKLNGLMTKIKILEVEKRLKRNKLLPKIEVQYNFLTPEYDQISSIDFENYKAAVRFNFPLFLRKERGDLRLAKFKIQETNFERLTTTYKIQNKLEAIKTEINSIDKQYDLIKDITVKYQELVVAEEKKFEIGESSLFLINSREQKLIQNQMKENDLRIKQLQVLTDLYEVRGMVN